MTVCPGYVNTGFQEHALAGKPPDERLRKRRRFAITAEECARAIARGVEREAPHGGGAALGAGCWSRWRQAVPARYVRRARLAAMLHGVMNLRLKSALPGIYLVGFMGCGKTTVGTARWRQRLGWSFVDLDDDIEAARRHHHLRDLRHAGRAGVPPHRDGGAAARACAEIETRPPDRAGAGRRRVRRAGEPRTGRRTTASASGWTARSNVLQRARARCATHRPLARDPEQFAALYRGAAGVLQPRRFPHPGGQGRPRRRGGSRPRAAHIPMKLEPSLRKQALAIFRAALAAADPVDAVVRAARGACKHERYRRYLRDRRGKGRGLHGARRRARARPPHHRRPDQREVRPPGEAAAHRAERMRPPGAGRARRGRARGASPPSRSGRGRTTW